MSDAEKQFYDTDGQNEHPEVRYEAKDIRFGAILALVIAAGVVLLVQFAVIWYFFRTEQRIQAENKQSPYPLAPGSQSPLPPQPRLEQIDRMHDKQTGDAIDPLAEMEKQLHSSGPTAEKGFVHIPIEEAMHKIADQLPVRKRPPPGDHDRGLLDDGASNSGHMFSGASP
jgi:hypothetical protein